MIVILASQYDRVAKALAAAWAAHDARLLTARDLSTAGWRYRMDAADDTAVVGGQVVAVNDITGVLTRLPAVTEAELGHIVGEDRAYVAAEMTALLVAWLSGLRRPVLNRPTPISLAGPYWRAERWTQAAVDLGIPVAVARRRARSSPPELPEEPQPAPHTVTVVGERCFGTGDEALQARARSLAALAGAELLAVDFDGQHEGARFAGANPWPDLTAGEIAGAVLARLRDGAAAGMGQETR